MDGRALANTLKRMYDHGMGNGEAVTMIHLFAIKYADEIRNSGIGIPTIVEMSGIPESYRTEIRKGMKLSKFVTVSN